jgi:hypothetical protein
MRPARQGDETATKMVTRQDLVLLTNCKSCDSEIQTAREIVRLESDRQMRRRRRVAESRTKACRRMGRQPLPIASHDANLTCL